MRIDSSGNVGIGTSSPAVKLDVAGNATVQNGVLTVGKDTVYDAFINTPESMYFNVDSDANSTGNRFVWGTDRAGTSGGTEWMRLDSSGNLGLGVTPSAWTATNIKALQVSNGGFANNGGSGFITNNAFYTGGGGYTPTYIISGASQMISFNRAGGNDIQFLTAASGTAGNAITFTQAMTLDASGNLVLGTTSAISPAGGRTDFTINGSANALISFGIGGVRQGYVYAPSTGMSLTAETGLLNLQTSSANIIQFSTNNTERMRLDSSGNLLVGTTALSGNGFVIQPAGNGAGIPLIDIRGDSASNSLASIRVFSVSLGQDQFYVSYAGTVFARSGSISVLSDQREKENIRSLETGLTQVLALQPRRFDWKKGQGKDIAGFIAQEVELVMPDLIDEYNLNNTETRMSFRMGDMIPTLVKAIQEQQAIIESLKARLDAANL
jgi:hypothetical protein